MVSPANPRRRISGESLLFAFLLVLHVAPIWAFPYLPTQDGPGHQALTNILREYGRPEAGLLRQYYALNREALPNWFIFFLTSRVLRFLAVPVAEKVLLTVYALLLPLGVRYALRGMDPRDRRAGFLAVLSFPFVYNYTLHMGFFNFCFSLPALFFTVGFWLRHGERMTALRTLALAALVLWVYFCHPVTLVMAVAALGTLAAWRVFLDGISWPSVRRWLLPPVLASLPAAAMMLAFVGRRAGSKIDFLPLVVKVAHLAELKSLASLNPWTTWPASGLALLFYVLALLAWRQRRRERGLQVRDGLLLVVAVFAIAYFLSPSEISGGGFVTHRLNLFPFLALILWLGAFEHSEARRRWVQFVAAALSLAFLGLYAWTYAEMNRGFSDIAAAGAHVEPDRTVLYLSLAHWGMDGEGLPLAYRTEPFLHAGGLVGAEKRLVDLSLYEANEDYFPIYYRPALNPYRHLSIGLLGIEQTPPRADILGYPKRTGGRVDYVLLWGLRPESSNDPALRPLLGQLAAGYRKAWASADGRVALYRVK